MAVERLSEIIFAAGFSAFAIMPAVSLTKLLPILEAAKQEKRYPAFAHPDLKKRINPQALQPSAQSLICLASAYYQGDPTPNPPLHGSITRSAWGRDYHLILEERMDLIITELQKNWGAKECTKAVDTSFLVDRALALKAGLGYLGGNCSVYVPPFGSWVFLSEILVDLKLPSTQKQNPDFALNPWSCPPDCDLCLKSCPTGALLAPGKIQPQRCLSYLTQMKGSVPVEYRKKLGSRLWGCDTCQQVCPQNKKVAPTTDPCFKKPLLGAHVDLLALLNMDKAEFQRVFGQTSLAWRGKNTLQRNACLILGNEGNPEALPTLKQIAQFQPSLTVQEAATWAIEQIKRNN